MAKIKPKKNEFTYHRPQSNIHSRVDKIYASNNLHITQSQIIPLQYLDHEALLAEFTLRYRTSGPGYWKLNTSILDTKILKKQLNHFGKIGKNKNPPTTPYLLGRK